MGDAPKRQPQDISAERCFRSNPRTLQQNCTTALSRNIFQQRPHTPSAITTPSDRSDICVSAPHGHTVFGVRLKQVLHLLALTGPTARQQNMRWASRGNKAGYANHRVQLSDDARRVYLVSCPRNFPDPVNGPELDRGAWDIGKDQLSMVPLMFSILCAIACMASFRSFSNSA